MSRLIEALRQESKTRRIVAGVLVALLLLGVAGVAFAHFRSQGAPEVSGTQQASTCANAYKLLQLRPSEITSANSNCLMQSLQFSGELSGAVAQAYTVGADDSTPAPMCVEPKRWSGFPRVLLAMAIGGKAYRLRISVPGASQHQGLTINDLGGVVELASIANPSTDWSQASGAVTLNADGITGIIDASLLRDVSGAKAVHVSGAWACGVAPAVPAFDASVPCARFYAINHLHDADVARMKSRACNVQDLSFAGDITARLDAAITDQSISPHPGIDGDNYCGVIGEDYTAALKFSIGDESFLLDLNAHKYPQVGPGRYPAGAGFAQAGAVLWLGHADPDQQGEFVTDQRVFWTGSASGTFSIAADMHSGTLDAEFSGARGPAGNGIHISGKWRCAP